MFKLAFSLNSKVVEQHNIVMETLSNQINGKFPDLSISFRIRKNLDSEVTQEIIASIEKDSRVTEEVVSNVIGEIKNSMKSAQEDLWVVIPLLPHEVHKFRYWAGRVMGASERDEDLAKECEGILAREFKKHGLTFNRERCGGPEMSNDEFLLYQEGCNWVAIPETCFIDPGENMERISNPLRK